MHLPRSVIGLLALALVFPVGAGCGSTGGGGSESDTTDVVSTDLSPGETPDAGVDGLAPDEGKPLDGPSTDGDADGMSVDTVDAGPPEPTCGSASGELPEGLLELSMDDGGFATSVTEQTDWYVVDQHLATDLLNQSVRFDLEHPTRIYGLKVRFKHLPVAQEIPVSLAIHRDFGHNGFDFFPTDPLWTGDLCRGDVPLDQWVTYKLDPPLELDQPVPLYVVNRREGADDPALSMDISPPEGCEGDPAWCCNGYSDCHSSHNLPQLVEFQLDGADYYFWNGISLSFPYDYMVRLLVEETDDLTQEEKIFQPVEDLEMAARQSWGDYDGDGWDDLLLGGTRLLRNVEGSFVDVSEPSGIEAAVAAGSGGVWGDYDNDGCLDLLVFLESYTESDTLLRNNCDGTFTDVTAASGLDDTQTYNLCVTDGTTNAASTAAAAWVDFDGDGLLDIYLGNEMCWENWNRYADAVWHNEGDGTFTEWTGQFGFWGIDDERYSTRGTNPIDFDQDGDVDLFANNYHLLPNLLYVNQGDGTVVESAVALGVVGDDQPFYWGPLFGHSVGGSWGDLDNDGDFDLVLANLAHPRFYEFSDKTQVFIQEDPSVGFSDTQGDWSLPWGEAGIRYSEGHFVPVLGDIDQDGTLDLTISTAYGGRTTDFYWGVGDGSFAFDIYHAGIKVEYGFCLAVGDFDHDGDLDMTSSQVLWRNTYDEPDKGHWLQVRPVGNVASNRAGIGATIRVTAGGSTWRRHVPGGTGFGCQDTQTPHFGLAEATEIDAIEVDFPGGGTIVYPGPFDVDQRLWLFEDGTAHGGWAPP